VSAGGAAPFSEPTPDVTVDFASNVVATRVTAGRTTLGTTPFASDRDVPPGPDVTVGTPGVLPFFVTLQRLVPGLFTASVSVSYTDAELLAAGIMPGSPAEFGLFLARFQPGTCTVGGASCAEHGDCGANGPCVGAQYEPLLSSTVDSVAGKIVATGVDAFSTFAVMDAGALGGTQYEPGAGAARTDCRAEWRVVNPNAPPRTAESRRAALQSCQDGDPTCDADGAANGSCVFRVAVCFNRPDPDLPTCPAAGAVVGYDVRRPKPQAKNPLDAMNGGELANVAYSLAGSFGVSQLSLAGDRFQFTTPITTETCSTFARLTVPTGKPSTFRIVARGVSGRDRDPDRLRLRCDP
jgi:hypothetical protein